MGREPAVDVVTLNSTRSRSLYGLAGIALGTLLMAAGARVSIHVPFSPVPVTGQTLALPLVVALLGTRYATLSLVAYLAEGGIGLPVFAGGASGVPALLGPTGGFLIAFPAAAFVTGLFFDRGLWTTFVGRVLAIFLGSCVVFAGGWAWLAVLVGPGAAYIAGVAPFLVGDVVKTLIAAAIAPAFRRI